jgi:hypothetical protein
VEKARTEGTSHCDCASLLSVWQVSAELCKPSIRKQPATTTKATSEMCSTKAGCASLSDANSVDQKMASCEVRTREAFNLVACCALLAMDW